MKYEVISADSHINEPPGTWIGRVPAKFKDAAPRIVPTSDEGEGWKFPDEPQVHSLGLASATLQKGEARGPERHIPSGLKCAVVIQRSPLVLQGSKSPIRLLMKHMIALIRRID
jgi:hypothetical protein